MLGNQALICNDIKSIIEDALRIKSRMVVQLTFELLLSLATSLV